MIFDFTCVKEGIDWWLNSDFYVNFAAEMNSRTFHYKISFTNLAAVAVVALAALFMFWNRSAVGAMVGLALMVAVVLMVERMIHTEYWLTPHGYLVVCHGRFSRLVYIRLSDITSVEIVRPSLLPVAYVLIRYGAGHEMSLRPADMEAFADEVKRRQKLLEQMNADDLKRFFF